MTTSTQLNQANQYPDVNLDQLAGYNQKELAKLFAKLELDNVSKIDGNYRGKFYGMVGIEKLPRLLRRLFTKFFHIRLFILWAGKTFHKGQGANLFFFASRNFKNGFYDFYEKDADDGTGKCVYLNYAIPKNRGFWRVVRGEGRSLSEGVMLCRMLVINGGKPITIGYFTLEPVCSNG